MGSIGNRTVSYSPIPEVNVGDVVHVIHYTPEENVSSLLVNEFDMNRAGEGAGSVWGEGAYYLEKGSSEDDMYSARIGTEHYIESDIDTSDFLEVNLQNNTYHVGKMFDDAAKAFNKPIHREYTHIVKELKDSGVYSEQAKRRAFIQVAKTYYSGLIVKHNIMKGGVHYIDPISGGNQIVVYDQSAIKNKKAGRNK